MCGIFGVLSKKGILTSSKSLCELVSHSEQRGRGLQRVALFTTDHPLHSRFIRQTIALLVFMVNWSLGLSN